MSDQKRIYHERQNRMMCAKHAINNLLQEAKFTESDLDQIGRKLSPEAWVNRHKTPLLGNYDVNVVIKALQDLSYTVDWFDKRLNPLDQTFENVFGFILNIPTSYSLGFVNFWHGKHWVAVRKINDAWYNLDSKISAPQKIGDDSQLRAYLAEALRKPDTNLFVIKKVDSMGSPS